MINNYKNMQGPVAILYYLFIIIIKTNKCLVAIIVKISITYTKINQMHLKC